jgi:hypothetical protein
MNKTIAIAAIAAGLSLAAPQVFAADEPMKPATTDSGTTGTGDGTGAASNQPAGNETSDRTPGKTTTTPETQVDKTKDGETSDRTPSKH